MTDDRPAGTDRRSRRAVLGSLAAAGAAGLAGCYCPTTGAPIRARTLAVRPTGSPRRVEGSWQLGVAVELALQNVGETPFERAELRVYDAAQSTLTRRSLGPFTEDAGYEVTTEDYSCGGERHEYRREVTLSTSARPKYLNPYVPPPVCRAAVDSSRDRNLTRGVVLLPGENWHPEFRCGTPFGFRVLAEDAPVGEVVDWRQPSYDAGRTAANPAGDDPGVPSRVRWSVPVESEHRPVVHGDAVYLWGRTEDPGTDARGLLALSLADGDLAWSSSGRGAPVVAADGTVLRNDTEAAGFDGTTGRPLWTREPPQPEDGDRFVAFSEHAVPTVAHGRVYVLERTGRLFGLSPADGTVDWTATGLTDLSAGDPHGVWAPVAADDRSLYVATADAVVALSPATGDERWRRALPGLLTRPTRVAGGTVYRHRRDEVAALSATDGAVRWRAPGVAGAVDDELAYLAADGDVVARGGADGSVRWRTELGYDVSVRALVGDHLYAVADDVLAVLAPDSGDVVGRYGDEDDAEFEYVTVAGGTLLRATEEGTLQALDGG